MKLEGYRARTMSGSNRNNSVIERALKLFAIAAISIGAGAVSSAVAEEGDILLDDYTTTSAGSADVTITLPKEPGGNYGVYIDGPAWWNWRFICHGKTYYMGALECLLCEESNKKGKVIDGGDLAIVCRSGKYTYARLMNDKGETEKESWGEFTDNSRTKSKVTGGDGKGRTIDYHYKKAK